MELPREPTEIPQARRYARCFHGEQGKKFREQETITINIPRINNTYMSKDTKLHFDFDMIYQEASTATLNALFKDLASPFQEDSVLFNSDQAKVAWHFFGVDYIKNDLGNRAINVYTKPIPSFDINGPYGLIKRIQVFDYLGNTLLEDVQEHDLLTAQFADFWFKDDNMEIDRPRITDFYESTNQDTRVRKDPCARIFSSTSSFPMEKLAVSKFDIVDDNDNITFESGDGIVPSTIAISESYSLDLFSFLGRFSDKFVPLHNGFKVVFTLNKFTTPIIFNTPTGDCKVIYKKADDTTTPTGLMQLDPTILSSYISNVYIKSDLLEISPELDSKVDKIIHSQQYKYQKDFFSYKFNGLVTGPRVPHVKRILPDLKSINKIFIGQRVFDNFTGKQNLGFRIKNYTDRARLLFNKAEVAKQENILESYCSLEQAMQNRFDDYLDITDFCTELFDPNGTAGQQLPIVTYAKRAYIDQYTKNNPSLTEWWPGFYSGYLTTQSQGRFLIAFDTRIPGATSNSVAGIDSSKNILEYELSSDSELCQKADIDVFIEHDSFIMVEPGKSTTVNF